MLEKLHSIGYTYNDLKDDNICIGDPNKSGMLKLIDFGLCSRYLDDDGNHVKQQEHDKFVGNMMFCSLN